jgi:transcriptional regulator with XRE-family HTH domain
MSESLTDEELEQVVIVRGLLRSGAFRATCTAAGVSTGELAERAGCSKPAAFKYLHGDRRPPGSVALRLAAEYQRLAGLVLLEESVAGGEAREGAPC